MGGRLKFYIHNWKENDIVSDVVYSNFLGGERSLNVRQSNFLRSVRVSKLMRYNREIYTLVKRLAQSSFSEHDLNVKFGMLKVYTLLLNKMDVTQCLISSQADDMNIKNKNKSCPFDSAALYGE